jgi:hypothetical protein
MRGFLIRIIHRRLQRLALGTAFGMALVTSSAVAASRYHDPGSSDAVSTIDQARILLGDVCSAPSETTTASCEKELKEVLDALARNRAAIKAAGGDVSRE